MNNTAGIVPFFVLLKSGLGIPASLANIQSRESRLHAGICLFEPGKVFDGTLKLDDVDGIGQDQKPQNTESEFPGRLRESEEINALHKDA